MRRDRWKLHLSVAVTVIAAMTLALSPAVADPVSGTDDYPDVAFLARNDVPFDAQTAASMAAQLGAPMFITNPNALADAAAEGIAGLNPEVIIVAGGEFAVSDDVANAAASACEPDCTVDRRFGTGRDGTAAALAEIAADYGFDRPVLQGSNQVVGDVTVGGTVHAEALAVEDTGLVPGLNADRLDGQHADDFLGAGEKAADSELLDGKDSTEFLGASEKAADSDLLDGIDAGGYVRHLGALPRRETTVDVGSNDGTSGSIDLGTFTVPDDCNDGTTRHDVAIDINVQSEDESTDNATGSASTQMVVELDGTETEWEVTVSVAADMDTRHTHARPLFIRLPPGDHTVGLAVKTKFLNKEEAADDFRQIHLTQRYGSVTSLGYTCG